MSASAIPTLGPSAPRGDAPMGTPERRRGPAPSPLDVMRRCIRGVVSRREACLRLGARALLRVLPALVCATVVAPTVGVAGITQPEVDEAERRFHAGDHAGALGLFTALRARATDSGQRHLFQWNIARCLEEMGEHAGAVEAFEVYIAEATNDLQRQTARERLTAIEPFVFGGLRIDCAAHERLLVGLEGVTEAAEPCPTTFDRLPAGPYSLVILDARRRELGRREVRVTAGARPTIYLGDRWQHPPVAEAPAPPPPPPPPKPIWWPWTVTIGGAGLVAVGGALHYENHSAFEDLQAEPGSRSLRSAVDQSRAGALSFYGVGLAAVTVGLVWLLWPDEPPPIESSAGGLRWRVEIP